MDNLSSLIRDIPDFPEPGIVFKDITPVLADGAALTSLVDALAEPFDGNGITKVAGIEARGFVLATPVADRLDAGFIPVRKPGKLPFTTVREDYSLEYGTDSLEIHKDALGHGHRVLMVDDLLATGGTAVAGLQLIQELGGKCAGAAFLIELAFLAGRARLESVPVHALIRYDE